jgi:beta-glucanase (GH16 family)
MAGHVFEQGTLALVARAPGAVSSGQIESGMLRSKWSGRYGYFECRMKVPGGRGMWPAFWLNPQDGKWPPEIDIVEIVNNGRDTTRDSFHFVHGGVPDERPPLRSLLRSNQVYRPGFDYQDDFHDFAVEWTSERVRHYVDGVLVVERDFRWQHADGADGGAAHVLVNLAVGGKWPGPPGSDALPAKLQLKHIRVWQL